MKNFFGDDYADRRIVVGEGDTLCLGKHTLTFVGAPMVHWPEVIVTYDSYDKVLFSADGFGKFGALDVEEDWADEARRYYIGIVGKYGAQVQALLKKAAGLDISIICPLHGPVLTENLGYYLNLYDIWSSYRVESDGIVVAYTSVYGHTKAAAELLAQKLTDKGCPKVIVHDLARCDMARAVEDAFRYGKLVLATTTYNADIFPFMKEFIHHLTERNFQSRTIGLMENGSWAPLAAKTMRKMLDGSKNLTFTDTTVKILSALNDDSKAQIESMANELCKDYLARQDETANKNNLDALFNIGYGLYVVTSSDGSKDNGLIVNTVSQVTNTPNRIAVTINKQNYSHHVIKQTGVMNVCCLGHLRPLLRLPDLRLPERPHGGQVRRHRGAALRQRPAVPAPVYQLLHEPEGGKLCGSGHPRHVHLLRHRGAGDLRPGDHDLHLLSEQCQAQAGNRGQARLCLQGLRLGLRGRHPARRHRMPPVQARRRGF